MNNNNVPTAKELLRNKYKLEGERGEIRIDQLQGLMIEFANLHVKAALEAANEKVTMRTGYYGGEISYVEIEPDSILTAYPLTNIK